MSQPKQAYYFFHDSNAHNDIKIVKLRRELGWEGYGLYWCLIELLREATEYKIPVLAIDDISFQIGTPKEYIDKIIRQYDLFEIHDGYFFSRRLNRSMEQYNDTRNKYSKAGKKGMETRWGGRTESGAPPLRRVGE